MPSSRLAEMFNALQAYRRARATFLAALECDTSKRDPFAEFSEHLVAGLLDAELAASQVQKGYDVTTTDSHRVQVRYLANPAGGWVNEHVVDLRGDCDRYALVVFEALDPRTVVVFQRSTLGAVCAALGERHPNQDVVLQLTERNYQGLLADTVEFTRLGVDVTDLTSLVNNADG